MHSTSSTKILACNETIQKRLYFSAIKTISNSHLSWNDKYWSSTSKTVPCLMHRNTAKNILCTANHSVKSLCGINKFTAWYNISSVEARHPSWRRIVNALVLRNHIVLFMVALCNRADHYIFALFISSPNLSGRRLDVYHTSTHSVALVRI